MACTMQPCRPACTSVAHSDRQQTLSSPSCAQLSRPRRPWWRAAAQPGNGQGTAAERRQTPPASPPKPSAAPKDKQQQQQQRGTSPDAPRPGWVVQLQQRWEQLDNPQKAYSLLVGLLLLVAVPRVLTLLVLGLERVVIGGLLAVEEVLLELLLKSGAVIGVAALIGLIIAGVLLFTKKS